LNDDDSVKWEAGSDPKITADKGGMGSRGRRVFSKDFDMPEKKRVDALAAYRSAPRGCAVGSGPIPLDEVLGGAAGEYIRWSIAELLGAR